MRDVPEENLAKDMKLIDAVVRRMEIIGEAARNVPQDLKNTASDIQWQKIIDFRNVLIHEYFGVDLGVVWSIVKDDLPTLKQQLNEVLLQREK